MRTILFAFLSLLLLVGIVLYLRRSRGPIDPPTLDEQVAQDSSATLQASAGASDLERESAEPFQVSSSSRCIAQVRLFAASRRQMLELAVPQLDVQMLEELRRIVRANSPEAADLLEAARAEPPGSRTQCLLLLAVVWSGDESKPVDAAVAVELAQLGLVVREPLVANDRVALSAIHALELLGDRANLGQVANSLVTGAWTEANSTPVFPGMTSVRAWVALRGGTLPLTENSEVIRSAFSPEQARFRVSAELWAAVASTAPETWAATVFERAHAGDEHAREGLAGLSDDRWLGELDGFLEVEFDAAHDSWCYSKAVRGLIAMDSDASFAALERELSRGGQSAGLLAEALSSWRSAGSWQRVLQLGDRLADNAALTAAWRSGLDRGWDRVRLRRSSDVERQSVLRALREQASGAGATAQAATELLALEPES